MAEIKFADGVVVVDDVYVAPINELTNNQPERFRFAEVMGQIGDWFTKDFLRQEQRRIIRDHLSEFGL